MFQPESMSLTRPDWKYDPYKVTDIWKRSSGFQILVENSERKIDNIDKDKNENKLS